HHRTQSHDGRQDVQHEQRLEDPGVQASECEQHLPPFGQCAAVMATIGWLSTVPPIDPAKRALPNVNTPPSRATNQYPWESPLAVAAMPTIGWSTCRPAMDPRGGALKL